MAVISRILSVGDIMRPPFYSMKDGDSLKIRYRAALAAAIMTIVIPGCSTDSADTSNVSAAESVSSATATYFESNERIDKFFSDYNSFAEIPITADMIERGNIRTKANIYIDTISITAIDVDGCVSIRLDANPEENVYPFFRDFIRSIKTDFSVDRIEQAWIDINKNYYEIDRNGTGKVNSYEESGIQMSLRQSSSNLWFELWEVPDNG